MGVFCAYPLCAESGVRKRLPRSLALILTATICGSRLGSVALSGWSWTQSTHIHRNGGGHSTRDGLRAHEKEVKNLLRLLLSALSSADALSTPRRAGRNKQKEHSTYVAHRETSMQKKKYIEKVAVRIGRQRIGI
jgi:hypothetical protein